MTKIDPQLVEVAAKAAQGAMHRVGRSCSDATASYVASAVLAVAKEALSRINGLAGALIGWLPAPPEQE